jgi:hypothetical protein
LYEVTRNVIFVGLRHGTGNHEPFFFTTIREAPMGAAGDDPERIGFARGWGVVVPSLGD